MEAMHQNLHPQCESKKGRKYFATMDAVSCNNNDWNRALQFFFCKMFMKVNVKYATMDAVRSNNNVGERASMLFSSFYHH